jgi:uncharacterized membrane-anchored protein YhcB (DUF1043 family)
MENAGIYVAIAALLLNTIGTVVGVTRALGKMEVSLRDAITTERKEIDTALGGIRRDFDDKVDEIERRFGETVSSLREALRLSEKAAADQVAKLLAEMNSFAMWSRDHFVRRDGFYKVRDDLQADIKELGKQLASGLASMERKIDRIKGEEA